MNKSVLIKALSEDIGMKFAKAEKVLNTIFNEMANALVKADRIEIRGFGIFKIKRYEGYQGRSPKTGHIINVRPKKLPFFKCGKDLKDRVDSW